jgi:hypothetical protein
MPVLKFNSKIYKKEAIQETISAYSSLAKFRIKVAKDYIEVKIDHIATGFKDVLADEFSNYVLGMTKNAPRT